MILSIIWWNYTSILCLQLTFTRTKKNNQKEEEDPSLEQSNGKCFSLQILFH